MSDRLDALCGRPMKDGRTYWTKIGAAFPSSNGGWTVVLDAMPAPQDGQFRIVLAEPRQQGMGRRQDRRQGNMNVDQSQQPGRSGWRNSVENERQREQQPIRDDLNDEIPF